MFYLEQIWNEPSPRRNNSPDILKSTEQSEHHTARMPSISTIASPQPYIFTINDDSNEPTIPYGFGRQLPIVPPSLNDLKLPPNPFNILATMAIANNTEDANDNNYSPEPPEPSELSPISTPPMNVSTFNSWETSYTTTNDDTFYSSDEPRRIDFLQPTPSPLPSPPRENEKKIEPGNFLSNRWGSVTAPLRSLRSDDPSSKGHPRSVKQELKNLRTSQTYPRIIRLIIYPFKHSTQYLIINSYLKIRSRHLST